MSFSLVKNRALSLTFLSLLASSSVAEVFEKLPGVPEGWHVDGTPRDDQPIRLQVALHQPNVAAFEQSVIDMSTPGHPSYGKHFKTYDQMKRMLLPSSTAVNAVVDWLESSNITDIKVDADWVNFQTTVEMANLLLNTEFMWYESDAHHVRRVRTLEYSVPISVAPHINMIQPTTRFGRIHPNRATSRTNPQLVDEHFRIAAAASSKESNCNKAITPQCLKSLYNIGDYNASADSGSQIGFGSFLQQYSRYSDLELFEENFAPYAAGQNFSVVSFNDGLNDQNSLSDSGEANLDVQYIVGVSSPLPVTEYTTGGLGPLVPDLNEPTQADDQNEPYLEFLQALLNSSSLPQVLSISYGEDEQTIPPTYARTVCNLFAQLGSRGVSVIFASGDSGVGSGCQTNDGTKQSHFLPQFPAACPWVTAVGATRHIAPESAATFSSGGFSDYWARPAWQDSAVKTYLNGLGDQFQGLFNSSGRGFPDVAAQGFGFAVYDKGSLIALEGTSCSAPVFSGVVALLNDARLKANQSALGFLNPWLYSEGYRGLNDIVDGGSTGCDGAKGGPVIPYASWNATKGWDPVTGLGTPNFPVLLKLALAQNQTRVTSAGRSIRRGRW